MAKETFNEEDGVWRTVGGRRIFIRNGQSLSDAMQKSGKFSRVAKNKELYKKVDKEKKEQEEKTKELDRVLEERKEDLKPKEPESIESKLDAKKEKILERNPNISENSLNSILEDYAYDTLGVHNDNIEKYIDSISKREEKSTSEKYSYSEIIDEMENAEDYSELYSASKKIADADLRKQVENAIDQAENDGFSVNEAYSTITSDYLDTKASQGDKNVAESKELSQKEINSLQHEARKMRQEAERTTGKDSQEYWDKFDSINEKLGKDRIDQRYDEEQPKEESEYELYKRAKEHPETIDPMTENSTDWEALEEKYGGKETTSDDLVKEYWKKYAEVQSEKQFNKQVEKNKELKAFMKENGLTAENDWAEKKLYKDGKQISYLAATEDAVVKNIKDKKYLFENQLSSNKMQEETPKVESQDKYRWTDNEGNKIQPSEDFKELHGGNYVKQNEDGSSTYIATTNQGDGKHFYRYEYDKNGEVVGDGKEFRTLEEAKAKEEKSNIWEKQEDGSYKANKEAMKTDYEERHKRYDEKIKQLAEDRENMTNSDWEASIMAYEKQNADGTFRSFGDIYQDVEEYEKKKSGRTNNEYTKEELKEKFGTDNVDLINAGRESNRRVSLKEENKDTFTSKSTNPFYPDAEYSKEELKRMEENGVKPMENTYSGSGWKGVNADKNLSTSEQAKAITSTMKEKYPDVKIARKSDVYSGGSSIHFNIMSSDKDLYISDADIDKMDDFGRLSTGYGFENWAEKNVDGFKKYTNEVYTTDDVKKYAKEQLKNIKQRSQEVSGDEWYLSDYGKKVVSELNKQANSYTYDDSDSMTDYFNHGTYMNIHIGKWDKPYEVKNSNSNSNDWVRDAFNKYKEEHPGTKKTFAAFKKENKE